MNFPPIRPGDRPSDEVRGERPSDELSSEKTSPMNIVEKGPPMNFPERPSDESPSDELSRAGGRDAGDPDAARVREAQTRLLELTACTCGRWVDAYGEHHVDCPAPYREDVVVLVAVAEMARTATRAACATEARVTRNR
jgi:hypothetical protein